MKQSEFKQLIKEAVKEAISEELHDILLEAVRAPRATILESKHEEPSLFKNETKFTPAPAEVKNKYKNLIESMGNKETLESSNEFKNTFRPHHVDVENGSLPPGEVGLDLIAALMNKNKK